jgi:N-methylhydantoinase B/oxoprolinase/acetone carboxylase alpha subunit
MTVTKTPDKLIIDFAGTSPQARGPINHAGNYADGVFLKKWLAPILRNLADTTERMAELDVNEGVVPLIDLKFPPPGTLLTPVFPAPRTPGRSSSSGFSGSSPASSPRRWADACRQTRKRSATPGSTRGTLRATST